MTDFIKGDDWTQTTLFPDQLDDYIAEDSLVQVIDVFVSGMVLGNLGFKTVPAIKGRPAYHPSVMLKIYIYGYLNRIQSSRRVTRWQHEATLEAMETRFSENPDMMTARKSTVEHPFGTIKSWMGQHTFR